MLDDEAAAMWARERRAAPGPRYLTPFAATRAMKRDPLAFVTDLAREWGDVVRVRMGPISVHMFFHPEAVRHILQEHNQRYVKGPIVGRVKVLIGEGLFTSEGTFWRRQRRLAQPAFHRERVAGFVETMVAATSERLDAWQEATRTGDPIDVAAEMSELTLTVVGRTLFGADLSADAADVGAALRVALAGTADRSLEWMTAPLFVPTRRNRALRASIRILDRVVYEVIARRRGADAPGDDLLGMLMAARDVETDDGMTARQLRDEVMTFFLAGHETTANALAWSLALLAAHPAVEERLRAEVDRVLCGRTPAFGDVPALAFTRAVVEEAMRLYPPVWGIGRQAIVPDEVQGEPLRRGAVVTLSPWVTHRHPAFWPDPERFDPTRFLAPAGDRPRFAYFPFSGGPRLCIGETFALVEAQIALAMLVQRYRLTLPAGHVAVPAVSLTLRPAGGLPMHIAPARGPVARAV
jgi:cytochrome P450